MEIIEISDPQVKSEIGNSILRGLRQWFGIESAIVDYVNDVKRMPTWVAYDGETPIGFASLNRHFPASVEIHVMGVLESYHRKGIGHRLVKAVEDELRPQGVRFLTVKTLSESRPNAEYAQTRNFYLKMGFLPVEEFKTLWGEDNPCLLLAKVL